MSPFEQISPAEASDADLVALVRAGDRNAFGRIVGRYQALICALAYNAIGNVAQSEDVAQETFVIAWKQLSRLQEPGKLRPWLCGIVRNVGHRARRGQKYEPVLRAEQLAAAAELPAPEAHPMEQAISREEEAILWRQLEVIPETYREPLILFYRQHASIEQVALALEISEDAVRQRLMRGRRLLQEQVLAFVASALARTSPKPVFTQSVLAALPATASSAKAVGASLAASGAAKAAWASAGPIGGALAMLGGMLISRRALAEGAKSSREEGFLARITWIQVGLAAALIVTMSTFGWVLKRGTFPWSPWVRDTVFATGIFCFWIVNTGVWRFRTLRQRQIQVEDGTWKEAEWRPSAPGDGGPSAPASMSFSVVARRSALSFVVIALIAARAPWRHHFALAFAFNVVVPVGFLLLTLLLVGRLFRNRGRYQVPSLAFLVGMPLLFTLLLVNVDEFKRGLAGVNSVPAVVLLNAGIILAYATWGTFFMRSVAQSRAARPRGSPQFQERG